MKINFKNQVVIVTGGTGNIGNSIIKKLSSFGAQIYTTSTSKEKIFKLNKKYKNNNIKFIYLDFENYESIIKFISFLKKLKKIDSIINNAGINKIQSIDKVDFNDWKQIHNINLNGPFILTKEISKKMIKQKYGRIINISSIWGVVGKEKRVSYSSTKWGLIGFTKSTAIDLAPYNILVNAVSPGIVKSKLSTKILGIKGINKIKKQIPLRRLAECEEIALIVAFLASKDNTYITGQNIIIDGGYTCA